MVFWSQENRNRPGHRICFPLLHRCICRNCLSCIPILKAGNIEVIYRPSTIKPASVVDTFIDTTFWGLQATGRASHKRVQGHKSGGDGFWDVTIDLRIHVSRRRPHGQDFFPHNKAKEFGLWLSCSILAATNLHGERHQQEQFLRFTLRVWFRTPWSQKKKLSICLHGPVKLRPFTENNALVTNCGKKTHQSVCLQKISASQNE